LRVAARLTFGPRATQSFEPENKGVGQMAETNAGEQQGGQRRAGDEEADELQAEQESAEAMDAEVAHDSGEPGDARTA
jgi:hypothetical protein